MLHYLKKLETYWKHSDCSVKQKLIVYDAVIRTKLIYGFESVQVNDEMKKKIDVFQLKGLGQILNIQTTYAQQTAGRQRTNTNMRVYGKAERELNTNLRAGKPHRKILKVSDYYDIQRRTLIVDIINRCPDDPVRSITLETEGLKQVGYGFSQVGGPRNNWWDKGIAEYWGLIKRTLPIEYRYISFGKK